MNYEIINLEEDLQAGRNALTQLRLEFHKAESRLEDNVRSLESKLYEAKRRQYVHWLGKAVLYEGNVYLVKDVDCVGWLTLVDANGNEDEVDADEVTALGGQ